MENIKPSAKLNPYALPFTPSCPGAAARTPSQAESPIPTKMLSPPPGGLAPPNILHTPQGVSPQSGMQSLNSTQLNTPYPSALSSSEPSSAPHLASLVRLHRGFEQTYAPQIHVRAVFEAMKNAELGASWRHRETKRLGSAAGHLIIQDNRHHVFHLLKNMSEQYVVEIFLELHRMGVFNETDPAVLRSRWPWLFAAETTLSTAIPEKRKPVEETIPQATPQAGRRLGSIADEKNARDFSLPYPTQRTILREAQDILKAAIYEFVVEHFPEKTSQVEYEYAESSSLFDWVTLLQKMIEQYRLYDALPETQKTMIELSERGPTFLEPGLQLESALTNRNHFTNADLLKLVMNLQTLVKAIGYQDQISKQKTLVALTSAMAASLQEEIEELHQKQSKDLDRITAAKSKLAEEEASMIKQHLEEEGAIKKKFVFYNTDLYEVSKSDVSDQNVRRTSMYTRAATESGFNSSLTSLSDSIHSPQHSRQASLGIGSNEDQRSASKTVSEVENTVEGDMPWGMSSINEAINIASAITRSGSFGSETPSTDTRRKHLRQVSETSNVTEPSMSQANDDDENSVLIEL